MTTASCVPLADVASVLVVDHHRVFAELLAERLRRETAVDHTYVACTVQEAQSAVGRIAPEIVLLDPDLEGGSGLDLISHLDTLDTRPRVVLLADSTPASTLTHGLPGSCACVSKESPFEELLRAIEAAQRAEVLRPVDGSRPSGPSEQPDVVVRTPLRSRAEVVQTGSVGALTERQAEVLDCLLAGMTRAEVACRLRLSQHTVRDHVRHLFRTVGVSSTPELLGIAGVGVVAEPRRLQVVPDP